MGYTKDNRCKKREDKSRAEVGELDSHGCTALSEVIAAS
jgi:hypothetical protein